MLITTTGLAFISVNEESSLVLGPYVGEPMEHVKSPLEVEFADKPQKLRRFSWSRCIKGEQLSLLQFKDESRDHATFNGLTKGNR